RQDAARGRSRDRVRHRAHGVTLRVAAHTARGRALVHGLFAYDVFYYHRNSRGPSADDHRPRSPYDRDLGFHRIGMHAIRLVDLDVSDLQGTESHRAISA